MQKLTEKAYVEISLYYEVKSAAIFGGSSDVGYITLPDETTWYVPQKYLAQAATPTPEPTPEPNATA